MSRRKSSAQTNGIEVVMPQLAESVVSATISKWLKQPGDYVEEYEPLCEIITDKVTAEIPSTVEGTLAEILVEEGATVDVGEVICIMQGKQGAAGSDALSGKEASAGSAATGEKEADVAVMPAKNAQQGQTGDGDLSMRKRYSPAVRALAEEHDIDLDELVGTGLGGRITRKDVLAYLESGRKAGRAPAKKDEAKRPVSVPPPLPRLDVDEHGRSEVIIDVTPVRNTIATRMRQSVSEIPHAWTMIEVDVTNLVALRNRLKDEFMKREGVNLTYLAFVIKAVVNAIKDFPIMNSIWAVDKIIIKRDINISLAVGTEDSVYTPVIKNADTKNIAGLAKEIDELTRKARGGTLTVQDMQGGTFTVNNTGSFGSILSQPIINYPQAANLTFEKIVKRPVVVNDMIAVRSMVNMCLSLDHRILDGVVCGQFLQRVKHYIENYGPDTQLY